MKKVYAENTSPENGKLLNQTGKGTPMGEFLRRYWWPIGISNELNDKPTMVRLLGQDLVLFRDGKGKVGLLESQCCHRGANLALGDCVNLGIQCRYHGWVFDTEGKLLGTPGEPDKEWKKNIRQPAYLAQEMGGIIFGYIGPTPAPVLPRFSFLCSPGKRMARIIGFTKCHWLPTIENGMDPIHLSFTHAPSFPSLKNPPEVWFEEYDLGIAYFSSRPLPDKSDVNHVRIHNMLMPGMSCSGSIGPWVTKNEPNREYPGITCRWAVPIDDENTMMLRVMFMPEDFDGEFIPDEELPETLRWYAPWNAGALKLEPYSEHRQAVENNQAGPVTLGYEVPAGINNEDAAICESIGKQINHSIENLLPTGDYGLALTRDVYLAGMKDVAEGRDPKGVFRDADHDIIHPMVGERFVSDKVLAEMREHSTIRENLDHGV